MRTPLLQPQPHGAGPDAEYQQLLKEGILAFQRCESCSTAVFPPRVLCPRCGGTSLSWEASAGAGMVYSTTALHPRDAEPYNVSLVDLDEGYRLMTNIVDIDADEVRIGMRVRVRVSTTRGPQVPLFIPEQP